jgi:hypothetical protein
VARVAVRLAAVAAVATVVLLSGCTSQRDDWTNQFSETVTDLVWGDEGIYVAIDAPGGTSVHLLASDDGSVIWSQYLSEAYYPELLDYHGGIAVEAQRGIAGPSFVTRFDDHGELTDRVPLSDVALDGITLNGMLVGRNDGSLIIVDGPVTADRNRWRAPKRCDLASPQSSRTTS